ncbi:uncharacterized protein LOC131168474 isoform X2 [Malania oleifera]|nr:uncharacterized protein LOC131168474 isoform X2 [Malania oleifera]XP_057983912.1 uncharacterized protein LOC131168474 isoform X2 [Malania oleifera]
MKSVSSCPVCKVPYRRREVRPAPHMDNLVSVYKSMEVASGITIFVTQNAPSTKLSDEGKQVESDCCHGKQETGGACQDKAEDKRKSKGKGSKKSFQTNLQNSGPDTTKPSFPTKKRVQVPQNLLSKTPLQPQKCESGLVESTKEGSKNGSNVINKNPVLYGKGEPVFSPFFWLREDEDAEILSQMMDSDHVMDTPLLNAPSFSDMKDSDEEMPSDIMQEGKVHSSSNVADCFDSAMFDWTQRPCSPELCSSPIGMQFGDTDEFDGIQEKELNTFSKSTTAYGQEPFTEAAKTLNTKQRSDVPDFESPSMTHSKNACGHIETKKSNKKCRKSIATAQKKHKKKSIDQILDTNVNPNIVADSVEETCDRNVNSTNLANITNKMSKKTVSDMGVIDSTPDGVPALFVHATHLNEGINMISNLPSAFDNKHGSHEDFNAKTIQSRERINMQGQKNAFVRSKKRKQGFGKDSILEVPATKTQRNKVAFSELSPLSVPAVDEKAANFGEKTSQQAREIKSSVNPKCSQRLRCSKKLKVSSDVPKNKMADDIQKGHMKVAAAEENQSNGHPDFNDLDHAFTAKIANSGVVLRKCETVPKKFQCAFCHSAEDSEASGEMTHYFNGMCVKADYNGGCDVIHSHRNCTEWAPNVYFEDEVAINLEAELARSRRIKCSLCGIKGAALGCYDKGCRRSFHFPCAKLVPQCRWDADNFVMLCPLHASSKLPNEISSSQGKGRKKCILKRQSHDPQAKAAAKQDGFSSSHRNLFGSTTKFVLCCSGLTIAEREIVSEFERLSGLKVLKKWNSSVTHVIASTDENGACRRTLKILMAILEGKWILSIEWIKACMKAMKPVEEGQYEINVDTHGVKDGPQQGRLRLLNKQPKLFDGMKFHLAGDFEPSYKGYLQDLVIAAGGTVLQRKPISCDQEAKPSASSTSSTFIIYSLEPPDKCDPNKRNIIFNRRRLDAEALSRSSGAKLATNVWVLNSIAACKLQSVTE